jgi:hypothetical protein
MSVNGVTWNKIKRLKGKNKKMLETIIIIEVIMWTTYLIMN